MGRAGRLALAELAAMRGRRLSWVLLLAVLASSVGGAAMSALVIPFADATTALEASTVVVSRGTATQLAITLLVALGVAAPYRDGSWLHAALAIPSPTSRLAVSAVPTLGLGVLVGAVAALSAGAAAALLHPPSAAALPQAIAVHLGVALLWTLWMLCLAHTTRSPLAVLALGAGLPLAIEPALAGLLAQTTVGDVRWALLPATALRTLAELPAGTGTVLAGPPSSLAPLLLVSIAACTLALALAAWLRARGRGAARGGAVDAPSRRRSDDTPGLRERPRLP